SAEDVGAGAFAAGLADCVGAAGAGAFAAGLVACANAAGGASAGIGMRASANAIAVRRNNIDYVPCSSTPTAALVNPHKARERASNLNGLSRSPNAPACKRRYLIHCPFIGRTGKCPPDGVCEVDHTGLELGFHYA